MNRLSLADALASNRLGEFASIASRISSIPVKARIFSEAGNEVTIVAFENLVRLEQGVQAGLFQRLKKGKLIGHLKLSKSSRRLELADYFSPLRRIMKGNSSCLQRSLRGDGIVS